VEGRDFRTGIWKALANGTPITNDLAVKHFLSGRRLRRLVDAALTVEGKIGNFDLTYAGLTSREPIILLGLLRLLSGLRRLRFILAANPTQLIFGKDRYQMFSNELRLTSPKDYPVRFVAGLFQQRQQHSIEAALRHQRPEPCLLDRSRWAECVAGYLVAD